MPVLLTDQNINIYKFYPVYVIIILIVHDMERLPWKLIGWVTDEKKTRKALIIQTWNGSVNTAKYTDTTED